MMVMEVVRQMPNTNGSGSRVTSRQWLRRLSRAGAWALLAGVLVLVISGWGITQTAMIHDATFGLINRRLANTIHRATIVPLVFFFLLHVLVNIRLNLRTKHLVITCLTNALLIVAGGCILGIAVYIEYYL